MKSYKVQTRNFKQLIVNLKVLYDDKEYRTKQLEDMTSKLKFQTEDLRKQKKS